MTQVDWRAWLVLRGIRAVHVALAILALVCAALSVLAQEPEPRTPLSNAFTFQGRAAIDGIPVDDTCDFRFSLFDAAEGGTQTGPTIEKAAVEVANGLFSTQLDFGAGVFAGDARFIAIELRCPAGSGTFAALPGRQELTATPYALYAQQVPYSGIVGGPPGFGEGWENVIVVAKSGGQFTTIQAAIDSITGASNENQFLVWVAPGIHEERITIPSYITVRGAGKDLTTIKAQGGATLAESIGVSMAASTALEEIRVEIGGNGAETRAIDAQGVTAASSVIKLRDVVAGCKAAGTCIGLYVATTVLEADAIEIDVIVDPPVPSTGPAQGIWATAATLRISDFDIEASRTTASREAYGIYALDGAAYDADHGAITVSSSAAAYGISHLSDGEITVTYSTVQSESAGTATGIAVFSQGPLRVSDSVITTDGQGSSTGLGLTTSSLNLTDVEIQPTSSAGTSTGIFMGASSSQYSLIKVAVGSGFAKPSRAIYGNSVATGTVMVQDSLLWGSPNSVIGNNMGLYFQFFFTLVDYPIGANFLCTASYYSSNYEYPGYDCYH